MGKEWVIYGKSRNFYRNGIIRNIEDYPIPAYLTGKC
jgi:hypothetical protein